MASQHSPLMRNFLYTFEFCRRRYIVADDYDMLNQHLYNDYHVYLSAADRRTLNTVGNIIDHIIYRLKDGNGSL